MGLFDFLGFGKKKEQLAAALQAGAVIIDVRSPGEFQGGHVKGAKNYPLEGVGKHFSELKKKGKPVVFCCASGMRSGNATQQAKSAGLEAYNGGGWSALNKVVKSL